MAALQDLHMGNLRIFKPIDNDWQVHKNQLYQYFLINGITKEDIKRGLLLNMCSETAYQLISSLCFPNQPEKQNFEVLIELLDKHFTPPKLIFREREKYYEAKQNYEESIAEWAARVRQSARNCEFSSDEIEVTLRDRFLCGLQRGPIKDRLYLEMPAGLTFQRAVEIARIIEERSRQGALPHIPPVIDILDLDQNRYLGLTHRSRSSRGHAFMQHIDETFSNATQSPCSAAAMPPTRSCDICAYYWVDSSARSVLPSTALHGGVDQDGSQIYVGRAFHDGDWIPAKVIPSKRVAYIPYGGKEHAKDRFQILCEQRFDWVPSHGGVIPPGAVDGGKTSSGETLYIGRVHHKGSNTVGKVHPSHKVCYIPFDGKEIPYQQYEILVLRA